MSQRRLAQPSLFFLSSKFHFLKTSKKSLDGGLQTVYCTVKLFQMQVLLFCRARRQRGDHPDSRFSSLKFRLPSSHQNFGGRRSSGPHVRPHRLRIVGQTSRGIYLIILLKITSNDFTVRWNLFIEFAIYNSLVEWIA